MTTVASAANRIFDFFRDARRANEAWSDGERDYFPSNADVQAYFRLKAQPTTERQAAAAIIAGIMEDEFAKGRFNPPAPPPADEPGSGREKGGG